MNITFYFMTEEQAKDFADKLTSLRVSAEVRHFSVQIPNFPMMEDSYRDNIFVTAQEICDKFRCDYNAKLTLADMSLDDCIVMWNNRLDQFNRSAEIHEMDDDKWWDVLAKEVGTWNLIRATEDGVFDRRDQFFFFCENSYRLYSFSNKAELMKIANEDYFIEMIEEDML